MDKKTIQLSLQLDLFELIQQVKNKKNISQDELIHLALTSYLIPHTSYLIPEKTKIIIGEDK
jgi:adenylosuccinate lyase